MTSFAGAVWAALRGKRSTAPNQTEEIYTMATQLFQPPVGSPTWFHHMVTASADKPFMHIVQMGPALAQELLASNPDNRSVRKAKLAQYSADMAAGKWTLNGEPIIVSKDGNLNDGQHRCMAVIDANTVIPTVILFGMERETRLTVDQGGARSSSDFLAMENVPNAASVAAIARMVLAYERNNGVGLKDSNRITSAEVRSRVAADAALAVAATFAATNATYVRRFAPASLIGFAFYVLSKVHHDDGRRFLEMVCRGEGLKIRDAAHTLREKLLTVEAKSRDRKLAMIFKAWNFHRRNMKVSVNTLSSTLPFPALI